MTKFREGDKITCVHRPDNGNGNYGKFGTVTDVDDGVVYVEYEDGNTGNSKNPNKYYQLVTIEGRRAGDNKFVSGTTHRKTNTMIDGALAAIKRATMSPVEKAQVKAGLKTECGLYTQTAIDILMQNLAATDASQTALNSAATAILADRKEKKEDEED